MQRLDHNDYTMFNQLTTQDLSDNLDNILYQLQETLDTLVNDGINHSWHNIIQLLNNKLYQLNHIWGLAQHLAAVCDNDEIRQLEETYQPIVTTFYVSLEQNKQLYKQYQYIKQHNYEQLNIEEQRVLDNWLRDFELSGIHLSIYKQQQFKVIQIELQHLSTQFSRNTLDATDEFALYVTKEELDGVPQNLLDIFFDKALKDNKKDLYKITLHGSTYMPIMQYCTNRALRENLYKNYVTLASELGNKKFDNTKIIQKILSLRLQKAKLLGFDNYAQFSLSTKMAQETTKVINLLQSLTNIAKPYAHDELLELSNFASCYDENITQLMAWDVAFFSEQLQIAKYNYSNEELKQYFQLNIVLQGLIVLIKQLYNVELRQNTLIPVWHSDVIVYDVLRDDQLIGYCYMDLFTRIGKQQGAWMHSEQDRHVIEDKIYKPISYIVCNFLTSATHKFNSLLSFDEVQTLFHEMGHALHQILTTISIYNIAGINGVEWDAVELPSQFMEYFLWDYNVLQTITQHVITNNKLPQSLYNQMLKSRTFMAGMQCLRQVEFAWFDISLHSNNNNFLSSKLDDNMNNYANNSININHDTVNNKITKDECIDINYMQVLNDIRYNVAVIIPPPYNRFPNTFAHIFAGGYASGYYSYKWAELLAADVFSKFDCDVIDTIDQNYHYTNTGKQFLQMILSKGGLRPMMDNFIEFMQREPQLSALIKYTFQKYS